MTGRDLEPVIVGITGGSGSGKSTLSHRLQSALAFDEDLSTSIISLDNFYRAVNSKKVDIKNYNWDHPSAFDWDALFTALQQLRSGKDTEIPIYDFTIHHPLEEKQLVKAAPLILLEGIHSFYDERVRSLMNYKIFVNCDDDVKLCRRLLRDTTTRGRTVESVLYQYNRFVRGAYQDFIRPMMSYADLIVPASRDNIVAVRLIVEYLRNLCKQYSTYENALQNRLTFFGDLADTTKILQQTKSSRIDQILTTEELGLNAQALIFPFSNAMKGDIERHFEAFLSRFTEKKYFQTMKSLHKIAIGILKRLISFKQIDWKHVQVIDYSENDIQLEPSDSQVQLLNITHLHNENFEAVQALIQKILKEKPKAQLIILNLLADVNLLGKLYRESHPGIISIVNMLCITDLARLRQKLNEMNQDAFPKLDAGYRCYKFDNKLRKTVEKQQKHGD